MIYDIQLQNLSYVGVDDAPFFMPLSEDGEKLILRFKSEYDLSKMYVTLSNGNEADNFRLVKNDSEEYTITVPDKLIKAGFLDITVILKGGTLTLKKWIISPIRIAETEETVKLSSYVAELETRLTALEERVKELEDKNTNLFKL